MKPLVFALSLGASALCAVPAVAEDGFGLIEEVPDEEAKKADVAYRLGVKATRAGKNADAIVHFERALAGKSDSSDLFYNLVQVTKLEKRFDKVALYGQSFLLLEPSGKDSASIQRDVDAALATLDKRGKPSFEVRLVVPPGARAFVDDAPVAGAKQPLVRLPAGQYTLRVDKPDHEAFVQPLTVSEATTVQAELKAIVYQGTVVIDSKPEAGVEVFIDDVSIGKTPLKPLVLPTGKKMLFRFQVAGYASWVRYVELTKGETVKLAPALEKE